MSVESKKIWQKLATKLKQFNHYNYMDKTLLINFNAQNFSI